MCKGTMKDLFIAGLSACFAGMVTSLGGVLVVKGANFLGKSMYHAGKFVGVSKESPVTINQGTEKPHE